MTAKAAQIMAEALELPLPTRAFVAEKLIESLDAEDAATLSPKWKVEIRKRCREVDQGTVELRDAAAVFKKAFASLA